MSVEKIKEQVASTKEMLANGFTFLIRKDWTHTKNADVQVDVWYRLADAGLCKLKAYEEVHRDGNAYENNYWLWFENEDDFQKSVIDSKVDLSVLGDGEWPLEVKFKAETFPIHLVKA